jgi:hypothetical protein
MGKLAAAAPLLQHHLILQDRKEKCSKWGPF